MSIRSNLGEIMRQKGMTYEELQFLAKIAPDTVARARDKRIATCTLATLEKIADALEINITELFTHSSKNVNINI